MSLIPGGHLSSLPRLIVRIDRYLQSPLGRLGHIAYGRHPAPVILFVQHVGHGRLFTHQPVQPANTHAEALVAGWVLDPFRVSVHEQCAVVNVADESARRRVVAPLDNLAQFLSAAPQVRLKLIQPALVSGGVDVIEQLALGPGVHRYRFPCILLQPLTCQPQQFRPVGLWVVVRQHPIPWW